MPIGSWSWRGLVVRVGREKEWVVTPSLLQLDSRAPNPASVRHTFVSGRSARSSVKSFVNVSCAGTLFFALHQNKGRSRYERCHRRNIAGSIHAPRDLGC